MSRTIVVEGPITPLFEGVSIVASLACRRGDASLLRFEPSRIVVATLSGSRSIELGASLPSLSSDTDRVVERDAERSAGERSAQHACARLDDETRRALVDAAFVRSGFADDAALVFELRCADLSLSGTPKVQMGATTTGRIRFFTDGRSERSLHDGSWAML